MFWGLYRNISGSYRGYIGIVEKSMQAAFKPDPTAAAFFFWEGSCGLRG